MGTYAPPSTSSKLFFFFRPRYPVHQCLPLSCGIQNAIIGGRKSTARGRFRVGYWRCNCGNTSGKAVRSDEAPTKCLAAGQESPPPRSPEVCRRLFGGRRRYPYLLALANRTVGSPMSSDRVAATSASEMRQAAKAKRALRARICVQGCDQGQSRTFCGWRSAVATPLRPPKEAQPPEGDPAERIQSRHHDVACTAKRGRRNAGLTP